MRSENEEYKGDRFVARLWNHSYLSEYEMNWNDNEVNSTTSVRREKDAGARVEMENDGGLTRTVQNPAIRTVHMIRFLFLIPLFVVVERETREKHTYW